MIFYNERKNEEKVTYIRCSCNTHGIEISRMTDFENKPLEDICLSMYTDNFYTKQYGFLRRWKDKIYKMWCILIGKSYRIEDDLVLSKSDVQDLIKALQKIEKDDFNESK